MELPRSAEILLKICFSMGYETQNATSMAKQIRFTATFTVKQKAFYGSMKKQQKGLNTVKEAMPSPDND